MFVVIFMSGSGEYMTTECDTREQATNVTNFDGSKASVYTAAEYSARPELWT
jgi:hypothetical protein